MLKVHYVPNRVDIPYSASDRKEEHVLDQRQLMREWHMPVPRLIPWHKGGSLEEVIAGVGSARRRMLVRITGGCGRMPDAIADKVMEVFSYGFRGYDGALVIGGTRMIRGRDRMNVKFGITEVGPLIRVQNPLCYVLGVVPRFRYLDLDEENRIWVVTQQRSASERPEPGLTTVVHPYQDMFVAANARTPLTGGKIWDDEVECCRIVMELKRDLSRWETLTICCDGGGTTEKEMRATAGYGWPVLVIGGSGNISDELAGDKAFTRLPNVEVCDFEPSSFRHALESFEVVDKSPARGELRVAT